MFAMKIKPKLPITLADWCRTARGSRSLRDFSDACGGLSIGLLSGIETGKLENPELRTVAAIAGASEGRCVPVCLMLTGGYNPLEERVGKLEENMKMALAMIDAINKKGEAKP